MLRQPQNFVARLPPLQASMASLCWFVLPLNHSLHSLRYLSSIPDHGIDRHCKSKFDAVPRNHYHAHAFFPRDRHQSRWLISRDTGSPHPVLGHRSCLFSSFGRRPVIPIAILQTWVVFTLLLCWIVYVWVTAPTFGAASVCNDATIYVILFVNVRATIGWLRWFFVTVAAITLFVMLYMPLFAILALWNLGTHREVRGENANSTAGASDANALELGVIPSHARSGVEPRRIAGPSDITTPRSRMATEIPHPPPRRAFTALSTVSDNKMFFSPQTSSGRGLLGRVLTAVYGVTMLELTIKRNRNNIGGDEGVWTFGQIVAMLVTAGSLNEVFHFILAEEDRGKKKRKYT